MNKKLLLTLISLLFFSNLLYAQKGADCIIIKEENSIICKYNNTREELDRTVLIEWIDPINTISRSREVLIPAGHGSVYDFRYIQGRVKGTWLFKVKDGEDFYEANFKID